MKQLIAFVITFLLCSLPACGRGHQIRTIQGPKGDQGLTGNDGSNGLDGANGASGSNGHNSLLRSMPSAPSCPNGGVTFLMGLDLDDDGDLSGTEVQQTTYACNGTNGTNGSNGLNGTNGTNAPPTPFTPVALVDPCGDAPGTYDEVFIRLFNGTLVASFSENANGKNTRFSVLTAGSYMTTDGDNCTFTVDANNNIINENHHY